MVTAPAVNPRPSPLVSWLYDRINGLIFLPPGGSQRIRRQLVEALCIRPGSDVLELGCGTGLVTAELLGAGAVVTAVDALPEMMLGARKRAPAATFVSGDIRTIDFGAGRRHVVISFVLHNLSRAERVAILRRAAAALAPGGTVGVLDWSAPKSPALATPWRRFVRAVEPSPNVVDVLNGALVDDAATAGHEVRVARALANGRAQLLILAPSSATSP